MILKMVFHALSVNVQKRSGDALDERSEHIHECAFAPT